MGYKRKSKPFKCEYCGKDFDKVSQLKRHLKDAHDKQLPNTIQIQSGVLANEK